MGGSASAQACRRPGEVGAPPTASQRGWEAAGEPSTLVAPASQAGSLRSLQVAICFHTLVLSWACCCLQLGFLLQTALPEGPLRRPMSALRGGWLALEQAGGPLLEGPTIRVWPWAGVTASQGDPDGHTSSVCRSPPTRRNSAEQTISAGSWPPTHVEVAGGVGSWGPPAPLPPVGGGRSHLPPTSLPLTWGAYLCLCLCTGERTFLSEMLPNPRGLSHHCAPVRWPSCPAHARQRSPVRH